MWHGAAGQAGAGAAGDERNTEIVARTNSSSHILSTRRQNYNARYGAVGGQAVALVCAEGRRIGDHGRIAELRPKARDEQGEHVRHRDSYR